MSAIRSLSNWQWSCVWCWTATANFRRRIFGDRVDYDANCTALMLLQQHREIELVILTEPGVRVRVLAENFQDLVS
ncbi:MAG: hypothetical protein C0515_06090 [Novosphingobium sp.]|nr:hypothetical protein [Novosphingobium sp.]